MVCVSGLTCRPAGRRGRLAVLYSVDPPVEPKFRQKYQCSTFAPEWGPSPTPGGRCADDPSLSSRRRNRAPGETGAQMDRPCRPGARRESEGRRPGGATKRGRARRRHLNPLIQDRIARMPAAGTGGAWGRAQTTKSLTLLERQFYHNTLMRKGVRLSFTGAGRGIRV